MPKFFHNSNLYNMGREIIKSKYYNGKGKGNHYLRHELIIDEIFLLYI